MVVKGYAAALSGVEGIVVSVEACAMPFQSEIAMTSVIGLPDHSIKESLYRCESAIMQTSYKPLRQKQIINLSPADLRKEGSGYDLPIAIVMLAMSFQIPETQLKDYILVGELALDGKIQSVKGVLSMAILAKNKGFKGILVPLQNANEAAMVTEIEIIGVSHLQEAADFLANRKHIQPWLRQSSKKSNTHDLSFSEVRGQQSAKRALEIACAGGHNTLLIGPPGAGKTLLANSLQSILPTMTWAESIETTQIHSIAGMLNTTQHHEGVITDRIIRSPHHSLSHVAMVGGGHPLLPGEISLAHNGVLFLDELPEFQKNTLESLRQPLEEKVIHLSRSRQRVRFPANFMLVASMNPCPCGYYNHPTKTCDCPPGNIARYLAKISGPLLDRIDLHVPVAPTTFDEITSPIQENYPLKDAAIKERIANARDRQLMRFRHKKLDAVYSNSQLTGKSLIEICPLDVPSNKLIKAAMEKLNLSARAYHKILKVSRTIADLENKDKIENYHIAEAIQYRNLDRNWGLG